MADLLALPTFAAADAINVVIESPRGSTLKLKYDPNLQVISLARPLTAGLVYPYDWGFVPSTRGPDGDPVDAFVMWDGTSYPGVVLPCRAIGVLRVQQTESRSQRHQRNDRVAFVPTAAARWEPLKSALDIGERTRHELEQFFLASVAFQGKALEILGWAGPDEAVAGIREMQKQRAARCGRLH